MRCPKPDSKIGAGHALGLAVRAAVGIAGGLCVISYRSGCPTSKPIHATVRGAIYDAVATTNDGHADTVSEVVHAAVLRALPSWELL